MRQVGIIGAGIIGLALARQITDAFPGVEVTVFDKESAVGTHQTGHNSGVVHAGIYYKPGSLKATLCRRGARLLAEYCAERKLPFIETGKLVVALDEAEVGALRRIEESATANGVPGLRWLDSAGIRDLEPHAAGLAALHSPRTAITDFRAVTQAFADDLIASGGQLKLGDAVGRIVQRQGRVYVSTLAETLGFDRVIVCAGLQSDVVARRAGDELAPAIVPFRGEYFRLRTHRSSLVRGLIYPVPDPTYPFLGVHFTRRVDGSVDVGPNAVLALAREGYLRRTIAPSELWDTLRWPGFRSLAKVHWRTGLHEMTGSVSRRVYLRRAQRYVPELAIGDVARAPAGVRAQAVDRDGTLVDDFRIHTVGSVLAVRNAPSPAATSSIAIAEHICGVLRES